jgi:Trypsin-like peptidase domain
MGVRAILAMAAMVCFCATAVAQVPSPKHESRLHHLFGAHRDTNNLPQRFETLKCALVLIEAGNRLGTGFYISADGDVATASHVLGDRSFSLNPNGNIVTSIAVPTGFSITDSKGSRINLTDGSVERNGDAWLADIVRIKTGTPTKCWLREADDQQSRPGEHLITMGFPGLSFEALTMYEGIMSARLKTSLPVGVLPNGQAVVPTNDYLRVQMPISTGLSGAPVIDDENRAIAVVTNAGGWTTDLDHLLMAFRGGAFNTPPPPAPTTPNTVTFTLNAMAVTAELAGLVHDYASPGYGDAVPLRYLRKPPQQNQPSSSQNH